MVHWTHLPVALWNDRWWDYTAVFSGSATIVDGEIIIMYPGIYLQYAKLSAFFHGQSHTWPRLKGFD